MISLIDNSSYYGELSDKDCNILFPFAGMELKSLANDNSGLLVFPDCLGQYGDNWENESLYHFRGKSLLAGNVVGFFGINDLQIQIRSRFDSGDNQYFFHYMLCRVFGINMLNWQTTTNRESIWDFLPFLFPYFLKRAMKQGLFRNYRNASHNDDHVRGTIDISRHIRSNIPFNGKVAYNTREYTANNYLISLVRHTIETIRRNFRFRCILNNDNDTCNAVSTIIAVTPDYSPNDLFKVIAHNLRPVKHPFYTEYTSLQKLCLQILRHEKITYGNDEDKVNGIVFKAEWLWEEYLNTILQSISFRHTSPSKQNTGIYYYEGPQYKGAFPDFYSNEKNLVIDAKYKRLEYKLRGNDLREDRFQLISYVHIQSAKAGILLYPSTEDGYDGLQWEGTLLGYKLTDNTGGKIGIYGFHIPSPSKDFPTFVRNMLENERKLKECDFA